MIKYELGILDTVSLGDPTERFYDGTDGTVEFDGVPVNQLNVQWLRQQIGNRRTPCLFHDS